MRKIVITGSTRGIGLGLAHAFLTRGCSVVVSGRDLEGTERAMEQLNQTQPAERTAGQPCDVRCHDQVRALWDFASDRFGSVDIWINNAGYSGPQAVLWETGPDQARAVIETNLMGVIHGSMVAVTGMLEQGQGAIYNMEGMGSDGRKHTGLTFYGTSKYAVRYFTDSLAQELKGTPVIAGALRPGMVITEMIANQFKDRPEEFSRAKKIFNIIADRVENVAPWLADQALSNTQNGARISYTSSIKLLGRMLASPFKKRDLFI